MDSLLAIITKLGDIALILVGFGLVVFIHELGHFLAAKWAGVRVLAFSLGFGPPIITYRKGLGFRRTSTEDEYHHWLVLKSDGAAAPESRMSPTEYRLNALPLGGYVKMLGQDDADPGYRSNEPDSYNVAPVWKRMVIICAGVTMNMAMAAALYVAVFMAGLKTEAPVVGDVIEGSPAAIAVADRAAELGITEPGLQPGDTILAMNGRQPASFNDIQLGSAMAKADAPMDIEVLRPGLNEHLHFTLTPEKSELGLLTIGILPSFTNQVIDPTSNRLADTVRQVMKDSGLDGAPLGSKLVAINDKPVTRPSEFTRRISHAMGEPVELTFETEEGHRTSTTVSPWPILDVDTVRIAGESRLVRSILGLTPVMRVGELDPETSKGYAQGLREGDLFVHLGSASFPSSARGMAEVSSRAGSTIDATVLRDGELIELNLKVTRQGVIGFSIDPRYEYTTLAQSPTDTDDAISGLRPGSRVLSIDGNSVASFADIARELQRAVADGKTEIPFEVKLPIASVDGIREIRTLPIELSSAQVDHLRDMEWDLPLVVNLFEPEMTVLKASGPLDAIAMGLHETDRVMRTTYLTFIRLFQGSISPKNLNGPVGIVHTGTIVAERGVIWLLFFFALVNINLAVVNFLPIPITDGGHMIFLIWEQITGKPVSVAVQNTATLAGLVLIVAVFLFVTYNDISRLLGS
ncbi:MAG: site-2 protease family protein [Phycisphaerales bacterium]|nr:site-2 protease family protein [Phycisphaerales bacterium]MCB9836559.1 site-2 protease family protein [Phycisphaera sp.]